MDGNKVSDEGAKASDTRETNNILTVLCLDGNKVSKEGAKEGAGMAQTCLGSGLLNTTRNDPNGPRSRFLTRHVGIGFLVARRALRTSTWWTPSMSMASSSEELSASSTGDPGACVHGRLRSGRQ